MSARTWLAGIALSVAPILVVDHGLPRQLEHQSTSPQATPVQPGIPQDGAASTLDDQVELALTVYNSNLALVRDVRQIRIPAGESELHFMDIAATVNPATVHFRSLSEPDRVGVLEQNYEFDLLDPEKLLRKYVGRDLTLVRTRQQDGSTIREEVTAHLLSYNTQPVWRIGNEIVTGIGADHIRYPALPESLYSRPTLIWTLQNDGNAGHRVEASYLAGQLSWNADYVLTVGRDDRTGDLDGWVTLNNSSGTAFRNASLQLVAGDLNRVRQEMRRAVAEAPMAQGGVGADVMSQEAFSEYHLYTLGRKTTIKNAETKQVSMLEGTGVPLVKRYVVNGQQLYYRNPQTPGAPIKDTVQVFYQFKNEAGRGLGVPMPAGIIRVYQADSRGGVQFAGEDRINHTPKDETIDIRIGSAFDVVAERKQTDFQRIGGNTFEVEYEVTLRNRKTTPITVEVNEPIGGTWTILRASDRWTKTDAWAAQFMVPVEAGATEVVQYRVRVTY